MKWFEWVTVLVVTPNIKNSIDWVKSHMIFIRKKLTNERILELASAQVA